MSAVLQERAHARHHLSSTGWISRHSENFQHLPPPPVEVWIGEEESHISVAPPAGSGWLVHPIASAHNSGLQVQWLDATDPSQREALFSGVACPDTEGAESFWWAHRAKCRTGLRIKVQLPPDSQNTPPDEVKLHVRHQFRDAVNASFLVVELEQGVRCQLIETHDRSGIDDFRPVVQNHFSHVQLAAGAQLTHLRSVFPQSHDRIAHHINVSVSQDARYVQASTATGSDYNLQRTSAYLHGTGSKAQAAALLLPCGDSIDHQVTAQLEASSSIAEIDALALAEGDERVVANVNCTIKANAKDSVVRQKLSGVALTGNPRIVLRPHLEIFHDQVQAAHGATWGRLPEDAVFFAKQRGLDDEQARSLITSGMARSVLERLDMAGSDERSIALWIENEVLRKALSRQLKQLTHHAY